MYARFKIVDPSFGVRQTCGRLFDYEICDAAAKGLAPIPDTTMGNPLSSYTK